MSGHLRDASLLMIPSGYKASELYSVLPEGGGGDLDFARSSIATRVNESGVVESVGVNVPRIDYTGGGCGKLLIEPQRTNLYLNSGTLATQNTTTSATKYAVSFYGTGTIVFTGTYSGSLVGTGNSDRVTLVFTATAGTLTSTTSGTVTNGQLEASTFPSSYIPTTSTTATRTQDLSQTTSSGISSAINSEEGVLFVDFDRLGLDYEDSWIGLYKGSNSFSNNIRIVYRKDRILAYFRNSSGYQAIMTYYSTFTMPRIKVAFKWKVNDFAIWANGVEGATDTSGTTFNAGEIDTVILGDYISSPNPKFNSKINALAVFPTALSDADLTTLTTL